MASRVARDPQGGEWTIRERWLPRIGGLPPNAAVDALDGPGLVTPLDLLLLPVGIVATVVVWLTRFPRAAVTAMFLPPWIEAVRETKPRVEMTWRARDRHVGPRVIDEIALRIREGRLTADVPDARFEGFDRD